MIKRFADPELIFSEHAVFFRTHELSKKNPLRTKLDNYDRDIENPYPHMMLQDVVNKVIPYACKGKYKFYLDATDELAEFQLAAALGNSDSSLTDGLESFMRHCAHYLMQYQEAFYDIIISRDQNGSLVSFELQIIPPLTVKKRFWKWVQYIPDEITRENEVARRVVLPKEYLVIFRLPSNLRNIVRRALKNLQLVGKIETPDFVRASWRGEHRVSYDQTDLKRSQRLALAEATKDIGWSGRNYFSDEVLEFYELDRYARFSFFTASLRQFILSTLNSELARVGKGLGFEGQIKVSGLVEPHTIKNIREELHNGTKPLNTIFSALLGC
ncbi:hypothetical protein KIAC18_004356 [Sporomusa sphaeroides]|uniref:hypothetical protein n=1 Tax=Sporomusa sphaeroides TaxID=47679 RepID=UPI003DA0D131